MINAGFRDVLWTDGRCPESKTVRIIAAFPHSESGETTLEEAVQSRVKEVVYKRSSDCKILADVYYPIGSNPRKALPIGQIASRIVLEIVANDDSSTYDPWRQPRNVFAQRHQA